MSMKRKRSIVLASLAFALLAQSNAQAGITRGCSAGYQIRLIGNGTLVALSPDIVVGTFSARRGCGNVGVADRCRRRARNGAHNCIRQHWDSPGPMPTICDDKGGQGVKSYPESWERIGPKEAARVEALALCNFISGAPAGSGKATFCPANTRAVVYATTRGGPGCKKTVELGTVNVNDDALERGTLSVKTRHASPRIVGGNHDGQTIADRTFTYTHRKDGKFKSFSGRSVVFSEFDKGRKRHIPFSPRYHDYYGCGRHAAQHMIDWMTRPNKTLQFGDVYNSVELTAHAVTKFFDGQKAVIPLDMRRGMNRLLRKAGLGGRYRAVTHKNVYDPQEFMLRQVSSSSPVVALIRDGSHWVTAMGYWSPILSGPKKGYFYHLDNGRANMSHWSHFDLTFSTGIKTVSAVIPSFEEGTMLTWAKR